MCSYDRNSFIIICYSAKRPILFHGELKNSIFTFDAVWEAANMLAWGYVLDDLELGI